MKMTTRQLLREEEIRFSCGCIFCDAELEPEWIDGKLLHVEPNDQKFACTNPANKDRIA
jgi:hypothetical protein